MPQLAAPDGDTGRIPGRQHRSRTYLRCKGGLPQGKAELSDLRMSRRPAATRQSSSTRRLASSRSALEPAAFSLTSGGCGRFDQPTFSHPRQCPAVLVDDLIDNVAALERVRQYSPGIGLHLEMRAQTRLGC